MELDRKVDIFDAETGELIESSVLNWRDDLPDKLPPIIDKEDAEEIAGGSSATLYFIDPKSIRFHEMAPTSHPCWVVWNSTEKTIDGYKYNHITITAVDATNGDILGYGTPPPYEGFTSEGPYDDDPCTPAWPLYCANVKAWFENMGYPAQGIEYPNKTQIRAQIQSNDVAVFYEAGHGNYYSFLHGCAPEPVEERLTNYHDIQSWIANYPKMPFTFLYSCDIMASTGPNTLEYEFRKGANTETAVVGGYHLSSTPCNESCGGYLDFFWQGEFLKNMSEGGTVQEAFEWANDKWSTCDGCFKFTGDPNLKLVPKVTRESGYGGLIGNVSFPSRGNPPNSRWIESLDVRFFQSGNEMSWSPVSATTSSYGYFTVLGVPSGTYDIGIKNWTCLSELETGVVLPGGGGAYVDFGATREGDANNDDWVTAADRSLLYAAWGSHEGDPNWNPHCDFDRDGWITGTDRSLMYANWGQHGDLA